MKYVIGSDLHGSLYYTKLLIQKLSMEGASRLILLGDLYYHGPRNPLPHGHQPMEVAKLLNEYKDIIIAVKGNCDAEVDQMISQFPLKQSHSFISGKKKIFLTHGHKYNKSNPPPSSFDIMIYGHEHVGYIQRENDKVFANSGSISLPKNNSPHSYLILQNGELELKDLLTGLKITL